MTGEANLSIITFADSVMRGNEQCLEGRSYCHENEENRESETRERVKLEVER